MLIVEPDEMKEGGSVGGMFGRSHDGLSPLSSGQSLALLALQRSSTGIIGSISFE